MARPVSMLESLAWAGVAAGAAHRIPQHVLAVDAGVSPSTVARLERAEAWPARDDDLGIPGCNPRRDRRT